MTKKVYRKKDCAPSHPGNILKSGFIEEYGLRIETVASLLGITRGHLSRIINGRNPVTPDIAVRLEILTETPASQWLAIQSKYDTYMLEQNNEFKAYKKILNSWICNSLPMQPKQRREDEKTIALVSKASEIAKHLNKKESMA